ncbi:MAG TPA: cyclic nucleotide-binding domain-containing protein [Mariprofundaceae bacterium]|nr:cyclic nucleotide-binding domain-containing protein [Mariprofundaceae bacterium]
MEFDDNTPLPIKKEAKAKSADDQLEVYGDLVKIYPDNLGYLRRYAELLLEARRATTATEVLRRLHQLLIEQHQDDKARQLIREFPIIGKVIAPQEEMEDPMTQMLEGSMGRLWTLANQRKVREGHHICHEGEYGDTLFLVIKGEVAVFKKDERGRAILLNLIKDGDIFGEGAFLNPGPRGADVVANKDSVILELPRKKTMEFILNHPHLQQNLEIKAELRYMTGLISVNGVLRDIPMHMRQHLAGEARIKHYAAKTIIHRAGEELTEVDMLLRGKAAYVMQSSSGERAILEPLRIGELIGDTSALFKASCPADLMALEHVSMAHIPYGAFKNVVEAYPPLREDLFRHAQAQRARFMRKVSRQTRG